MLPSITASIFLAVSICSIFANISLTCIDPKSRALNDTSLTLMDVRAAVEWVYENIEAFGGNPENIMVRLQVSSHMTRANSKQLWGQSQGALLTHLYTLAWPEEPLAAKFGVISQGASATLNLSTTPDVYQDFDIVAKGLGCNYGDDAEAELECMRGISWVQIEEYINRYNSSPSIAFTNYIRMYPSCCFNCPY